MSLLEAFESRIEIKKFSPDPVPDTIKSEVLEAARAAPSSWNSQHWRFILIDNPDRIEALGERSPSGAWVAGAAFAVVVVSDGSVPRYELDVGKAITHMQTTAWDHGVGSAMYTVEAGSVRELIALPEEYKLTATVGFGYPTKPVQGIKDRNPIEEIAFHETFGTTLEFGD